MPADPSPDNPASASQSAAAATIARVLEQVGVTPERVDYDEAADGGLVVRVVIEEGVSELLCDLTAEGDLISARLIEL